VGVQELPRAPGTTLTDVVPEQVPFEDGHLQVPEGPGLGIEFDESAFEDLEPYEPGEVSGHD